MNLMIADENKYEQHHCKVFINDYEKTIYLFIHRSPRRCISNRIIWRTRASRLSDDTGSVTQNVSMKENYPLEHK
jgi:hypothetical protein